VQRQFETNRVAKSIQAQAYEEALPVIPRKAAMMFPSDADVHECRTMSPQEAA
jgi:hypothetical protein